VKTPRGKPVASSGGLAASVKTPRGKPVASSGGLAASVKTPRGEPVASLSSEFEQCVGVRYVYTDFSPLQICTIQYIKAF